MKTLYKILLIVLLVSGISSCGTRNTKKTESKESTKNELDINVQENKTVEKQTVNEKTNGTNKEVAADVKESNEKLEPIDPAKPMTKTESIKDGVKTTTWNNAKVNNNTKTDRSKTNEASSSTEKNNVKEKSSDSTITIVKKKDEAIKSASDNGTQRSTGFPWWTLWFLLIIPIYIAYRKFKY